MKTNQFDLQIVTDEKDILRKFALRMVHALRGMFPDYTADIKRMWDVVACPQEINYTCKKILFITWGYDNCTGSRVSKWLNILKPDQKGDRFLLVVTEDLYGTQLEATDSYANKFESENQVKVSHIKCMEHWWPNIVRFLFSITFPRTTRYRFYIKNLQGDTDTPLNIEEIVTKCLGYFNVSVNNTEVSLGRGCNVYISSNGLPNATQSSGRNDVYLSNNLRAVETCDNHYNREHLLAGILRIYSRTGILKPPLKETIIIIIKRLSPCFKVTAYGLFLLMWLTVMALPYIIIHSI